MTPIKFGTSGWRDVIGRGFTFDNARIVVRAIAEMVQENDAGEQGLLVGYDSRFLGEEVAREAAGLLAAAGIKCFLCSQPTPTPVIAFGVLQKKTAGAINFTASHNSPEYNGIKFSPAWAGPALPETTSDIERRIQKLQNRPDPALMDLDTALKKNLVEWIEPRQSYFLRLRELVDVEAIVRSGLGMAVNPLYGAGIGYLDRFLRQAGAEIICINNHRNPGFGGNPPDPSARYLKDFIAVIKNDPNISLGLATDGDADRYGIIDGDGTFIEPNYILALLLDYLSRKRTDGGDAARSVATSHFVDAVAASYGAKVYETPVGFKYIGEYIRDGKILIGGEESAGLTVRGHVPEKDGILACLLVAEMVAVEGKSIAALLQDLYDRVGPFFTHRENIRLTDKLKKECAEKLASLPDRLAGKNVKNIIRIDGTKLLFEDGTWMLFRESGTEPVVRVYIEAFSQADLESMKRGAVHFIGG